MEDKRILILQPKVAWSMRSWYIRYKEKLLWSLAVHKLNKIVNYIFLKWLIDYIDRIVFGFEEKDERVIVVAQEASYSKNGKITCFLYNFQKLLDELSKEGLLSLKDMEHTSSIENNEIPAKFDIIEAFTQKIKDVGLFILL